MKKTRPAKRTIKSVTTPSIVPVPKPVVEYYLREKSNPKWSIVYALINQRDNQAIIRQSLGIECRTADFVANPPGIQKAPEADAKLFRINKLLERMVGRSRQTGEYVDAEAIRLALAELDELGKHVPLAISAIDDFIDHQRQRLEAGQVVQRTYWKNVRWASDFRSFLLDRCGKWMRLADLRMQHIRDYALWLSQKRGLSTYSAERTCGYAKVIMAFCVENEWLDANPFSSFRTELPETERETLTPDEIKRILTVDLTNTGLESVRDCFAFMCMTGLAYVDLEALRHSHLSQIKGDWYIIQPRQKMIRRRTSHTARIPLAPAALTILIKYDVQEADKPLIPLYRNAALNRSLKVLANMAGIRKSVSTKVARNSLANYLLNAGMPVTSVAAMLGHKDTATTMKYYAKISPETVGRDLKHVGELYDLNGH